MTIVSDGTFSAAFKISEGKRFFSVEETVESNLKFIFVSLGLMSSLAHKWHGIMVWKKGSKEGRERGSERK